MGGCEVSIYGIRRMALLLAIFFAGVSIGGDYPKWFLCLFGASIVLLLILWDEARMKQQKKTDRRQAKSVQNQIY